MEAAIADDPDSDAPPVDLSLAVMVDGDRKTPISIRVDPEVLDWFRAAGPGYQTRMNAVLRRHVAAAKRRAKAG